MKTWNFNVGSVNNAKYETDEQKANLFLNKYRPPNNNTSNRWILVMLIVF